ncbi:hypothetical protein [Paenibacillus sp. CMAA1364]
MNIGSLIRGLLGEQKPGEFKQLDVKEGQVVRGVVLSVSDSGKEAEIQIQGVKVHAKLETPVQQGQATLLQVQAPDEDGLMVLKPLAESPYSNISAKTMADVLKTVGLTDTNANREMLQTLQASGVPLTKENVALFKSILMEKPVGVSTEKWLQSAAIAFQRGLPMTGESVRGLQQAVFGPPLHQLLLGLSEQLTSFTTNAGAGVASQTMITSQAQVATGALAMQASPDVANGTGMQATQGNQAQTGNPAVTVGTASSQGNATASTATGNGAPGAPTQGGVTPSVITSSPLQPLIAKLQDILQQLRGTQLPTAPPSAPSAMGSGQPVTATLSDGMTAGASMPPASAQATSRADVAGVLPPLTQAATMGEAPAGASLRPAPTQGEASWVGQMLKLLGAEHEQHAVRGGATPQAAQAQAGNAQQASATAPPTPTLAQQNVVANQGVPVAAQQSNAATTVASANVPVTAQQQVTQETSVLTGTQANGTSIIPEGIRSSVTPQMSVASNLLNPEVGVMSHESLKGTLLQMLDMKDLPPALKEAAQQLVQHMTGQQLLLNTDRTAPFAQVTMFIPLNGQDGEETASVHIQSRRGKKGELDASNCRLWFDLDMKHLGSTLIDVQVVDKIVSLKVHNDHEWMTTLIEGRRDEIAQAIHAIGYQLFTLKTEPLPQPTVAAVSSKQGSVTSEYAPPIYKGVDMFI